MKDLFAVGYGRSSKHANASPLGFVCVLMTVWSVYQVQKPLKCSMLLIITREERQMRRCVFVGGVAVAVVVLLSSSA